MSIAAWKTTAIDWQLDNLPLTADQRASLEREREGWQRLDPIGIWDLVPDYRPSRPNADRMIAESIEAGFASARQWEREAIDARMRDVRVSFRTFGPHDGHAHMGEIIGSLEGRRVGRCPCGELFWIPEAP